MNQFPTRGVKELFTDSIEQVGFLRAQRRYFAERALSLGAIASPSALNLEQGRATHVVVIPQEGQDNESFGPGTRNLYYEAGQSLIEMLGLDSVSFFHVSPGESPESWHERLIAFVGEVRATHVLGHVESDPGQVGAPWTWDTLWAQLSACWDGVLLGVMFDSSYRWLAAQSRVLARTSERFLLIDICIPMNGKMVRGRPEVGPVNMPMSHQSLALLHERISRITPEFDVSFIGAMYPYRIELVEQLRASGVSVAVNPHRKEVTEDFESSRQGQPAWLDYMAGLASSRMTLNFSQSSAGRFEQLKTRVLEATLAGTLLLTDDRDRTSRFFVPEKEYGSFENVEQLPGVVEKFLSQPVRAAEIATAGSRKAHEIAPEGFWRAIEAGLASRDLLELGLKAN